MKGVVFTEFIDLVEDKFGLEILDRIIESSDLSTGGAYTAVGTYDHNELLQMVTCLAKETGADVPALCQAFGQHLFGRLAASHAGLVSHLNTVTELLHIVENTIHVQVKKLYPAAELPSLTVKTLDADTTEVRYSSSKPFADVAEGLIRGCADHFCENYELTREDSAEKPGFEAVFVYRFLGKRSATVDSQEPAHVG